MCWRLRGKKNVGPLRVNLSKSGLGFSFGGKGLRSGRDSKGRIYSSFSAPVIGLRKRRYYTVGATSRSRGGRGQTIREAEGSPRAALGALVLTAAAFLAVFGHVFVGVVLAISALAILVTKHRSTRTKLSPKVKRSRRSTGSHTRA